MFYKQSMNNIEMVILCLDGGILDLNRLRYNYYNRICKQYNQTVSKEEFAMTLGNVKTMYNHSPVQQMIDNDKLNDLIERDLYEYAKLKQNIKKDGIDELLQFLRQKKIKIAVVSTHKTKRAIQYLQLTQVYQYVDFVIGGDSENLPLPNPSILHTICQQMNIREENTLVVANFPNLVNAARELFMNVVYMKDLIAADSNISASVYKTVKNNLEMINVFLFAKYDTVEMYSPVLGMSKNMDLATLERTYQHLLIEYQDDPKLIQLVKNTYRYFLMEINEEAIRNKKEQSLNAFHFDRTDYKEDEMIEENEILKEVQEIEEVKISQEVDETKNIENTIDIKEGATNKSIEDRLVNIDDASSMEETTLLSFGKEASNINALMDRINGSTQELSKKNVEKVTIEDDEEKHGIIDSVLDFLYITIISFITTFVSLLIYMVAEDYIQTKGVISGTLKSFIDFYISVVRLCYIGLFDGLHAIISFIPNYKDIVSGNSILSSLAIQIIMFTVFNIVLFYIAKTVYRLINKGLKRDDY